jgi:peptide/nickel transport system substrate-binding protein
MAEDNPRMLWLPGRLSRRQLLIGGAAIVGLAACGSDSKSTSETGGGGSTPATGGAGSTPETGGTTATSAAAGSPKTGGTLRVGVVGGTNDIIDGQYIVAKPDQARLVAGWETLVTYDSDFNITFDEGLAEDVEAKAADLYVIRLREGIEFHNGKTLTADDLVYSFQRVIDPDLGLYPALANLLDTSGITKVDDRTVQIQLKQGAVTFMDSLAAYAFGIVPVDYARFDGDPTTQIGTGAFMLESFTPGSESKHVRNPNYWKSGKPYVDEVDIIDFADATALVNALLAGQVDCSIDVPFAQVETIKANSGYKILESQAGSFLPITMAVDQAPFDDVRVRQAFRLIVDRDEMVERVLSGYGRVANDLYSPFDSCFASDLPQRVQDIDQAKALLKEAGQENLTIDLFAPNDTAGLADMAAVFADQAKKAGVTVNVQVLGSEYWGDEYCKRTFATSFWGTRPYLSQVAAGNLKDATYPETHWPPEGSDFANEYLEALQTVDKDARCAIVHKMQEEEYNDGGNIIAFFNSLLDGYSQSVQGLNEQPNVLNLDHFGHGFQAVWLET